MRISILPYVTEVSSQMSQFASITGDNMLLSPYEHKSAPRCVTSIPLGVRYPTSDVRTIRNNKFATSDDIAALGWECGSG